LLNLCESAIDEELDSCDEAAVFRSDEYDGFGDLAWSSEAAKRNAGLRGPIICWRSCERPSGR